MLQKLKDLILNSFYDYRHLKQQHDHVKVTCSAQAAHLDWKNTEILSLERRIAELKDIETFTENYIAGLTPQLREHGLYLRDGVVITEEEFSGIVKDEARIEETTKTINRIRLEDIHEEHQTAKLFNKDYA